MANLLFAFVEQNGPILHSDSLDGLSASIYQVTLGAHFRHFKDVTCMCVSNAINLFVMSCYAHRRSTTKIKHIQGLSTTKLI